ncbi:MAG: cell division FtsA domain-containing protein [Halanaerobiaceae bacterium]
MIKDDTIFALDIGTRTIIGLLLRKQGSEYIIEASAVREHENRAMLDGQIHNVNQVAEQVEKVKQELEEVLERELDKVAIAAAGRALKTETGEYTREFEISRMIEEEDVRGLDFAAVQRLQEKLSRNRKNLGPGDYHFIGYSVIEYRLDNIPLSSLVGQRGSRIQVKLVATFLPRIVIDSLLSVISKVGLEVDYLTLEPIAASEVVIPGEMYSFNLALVDIGAGTSDIALTEDGSMIGYGMVPVAGDEITEALCEEYLLSYREGERVKRLLVKNDKIEAQTIMGDRIIIDSDQALEYILPEVEKLADLITSRIMDINSSVPQAVMCIGGGALTPLLRREIARELDLKEERVGIRKFDGLERVQGRIDGVNGPQALTPVGIGVSALESGSRAAFVTLEVNGSRLQVFTPGQPKVADALLAAELDIDRLSGRPGMGLTCTVNGELTTVKGEQGEPGYVLVNDERADLEEPVESGDRIEFVPGRDGNDAEAVVADVLPEEMKGKIEIMLNGTQATIEADIYQNGEQVTGETPLVDGAEITCYLPQTVGEAVSGLLEIPEEELSGVPEEFEFNGERKKLYHGSYVIKSDGELILPSVPLKEGMQLYVEESSDLSRVQDLLNGTDLDEIEIIFNGRRLEISSHKLQVFCNGERIGVEYEIQSGDKIEIRDTLTVDDVLEYINYNISPTMKQEVKLTVNGEEADFGSSIEPGDAIQLTFS